MRKIKRPDNGGARCWRAYLLGEDENGLFFHSQAGSIQHLADGKPWRVPFPMVQLLTHGQWWVAHWFNDPDGRWVGVDICIPVTLVNGTWTYVDLELDPVGNEEGFDFLEDLDEFEYACGQGWISNDEADAARRTAQQIEAMMNDGAEPFKSVGWRRLTEAAALSLTPLHGD